MALLPLLSVGLPLAQSFLESRAIGKANKKNKKAMAMSNLINALSPRANNQPNLVEPKRSGLLKAIAAANTGLGAYNTFQSLTRGKELEELALGKARGEDVFAREALARNVSSGPSVGLNPSAAGGTAQNPFQIPEHVEEAKRGKLSPGEAAGFVEAQQTSRSADDASALSQARVFDLKNPEIDPKHAGMVSLAKKFVDDPDTFRGLPEITQREILPILSGLGADVKTFAGRDMSSQQETTVRAGADLQAALISFYRLVDENKQYIGKTNLAASPEGQRALSRIDAEGARLAIVAATAAQSGVLSAQDVEPYKQLFPDRWDSWIFAQQAMTDRMRELEDSGTRYIGGVRQSGFYVSPKFDIKVGVSDLWRQRLGGVK